MKILLIDDDTFLRDMYATKFTELNHFVIAAESGQDALNKLAQDSQFDVIVSDMVMPGIGGAELLATIKKEYPQCPARFIVLSNQGQPEDIESATEAGAIGYIIKAESIPSGVVKQVEKIMSTQK